MVNNVKVFLECLQIKGGKINSLSVTEEESYRQEWFLKVVPPNLRQKAINSYCFNKDGCIGYLFLCSCEYA